MPRLTISLFGDPQIAVAGAEAASFDRNKPIALLAYLVVTGMAHTRRSLALLLWPESANARTHLRGALLLLRHALGEDAARWLADDRETVAFRSDADGDVDVLDFRALLGQIRAHRHPAGQLCAACRQAAEIAVALYRGEFLADFSLRDAPEFEAWLTAERESLRMAHAGLLAALAETHAAAREWDAAITHAQRWLALDPYDEAAHRKLMLLYTWCGRRTLALRQYEECARILRAELDAPPDAATEALARAIRSGEIGAVETLSQAIVASSPSSSTNLPARMNRLIGRSAHLDAIVGRLRQPETRLLTLTGPGGVGKTSLGIAAAGDLLPDFADGVYFIALAPLLDPALVPAAIASVLEVRESQQRTALNALRYTLRDRRLLLVLDNYEHLLPAAPVVAELLGACPHLKVLATSREPLHLYGEHVYRVPRLSVPDTESRPSQEAATASSAVQLFVQRAQAVRHDFALDSATIAPVVEICRRLDGLPLAIELAAARLRHFTAPELLHRLAGDTPGGDGTSSGLAVLKNDVRNLPERHRSLWETIAWSYDLLSADEQALFRRLALFVGGWTVEAAQAVCADGLALEVEPALWSLVDKHLIQRSDEAGDRLRFTMLETLREFAAEQLRLTGELVSTQQRMAEHYAAFAERANLYLHSASEVSVPWYRAMAVEYPNLRASLAWALAERHVDLSVRLCAALIDSWRSNLRDGEQATATTLALAANAPPSAPLINVCLAAGQCARLMGKPDDAETYMSRAIQLAEQLDVEELSGSQIELAYGLLAWTAFDRGDYALAEAYHPDLDRLTRRSGNEFELAMYLVNAGRMELRLGNFEQASRLIDEALLLHRQVGEVWGLLKTLADLAELYVTTGELDRAAVTLAEAETLLQRVHMPDQMARIRQVGALHALRSEDAGLAAQRLAEALDWHEKTGSQTGIREEILYAAELAMLADLPEAALSLLGAHGAVMGQIGYVYHPVHRRMVDTIVSTARGELDPTGADAAWARGQAMTEEATVAYVVGVLLPSVTPAPTRIAPPPRPGSG